LVKVGYSGEQLNLNALSYGCPFDSLLLRNAQMESTFEQTLVEVWQHALVENAKSGRAGHGALENENAMKTVFHDEQK